MSKRDSLGRGETGRFAAQPPRPGEELRLAAFVALMALAIAASEGLGWPASGPWVNAKLVFGLVVPLLLGLGLTQRRRWLGLGLGSWRRGLGALATGVPLALLAMLVLLNADEVQSHYAPHRAPPAELLVQYLPGILQSEVCFRGALLFGLLPRLGAPLAVAVAALPYALVHLDKPMAEALGSVPVGLGLGALAVWSGSLWCGAAIHLTGAVFLTLLAGS